MDDSHIYYIFVAYCYQCINILKHMLDTWEILAQLVLQSIFRVQSLYHLLVIEDQQVQIMAM